MPRSVGGDHILKGNSPTEIPRSAKKSPDRNRDVQNFRLRLFQFRRFNENGAEPRIQVGVAIAPPFLYSTPLVLLPHVLYVTTYMLSKAVLYGLVAITMSYYIRSTLIIARACAFYTMYDEYQYLS